PALRPSRAPPVPIVLMGTVVRQRRAEILLRGGKFLPAGRNYDGSRRSAEELGDRSAAKREDLPHVARDSTPGAEIPGGAERHLVPNRIVHDRSSVVGDERVRVPPRRVRTARLHVDETARRIPFLDAALPADR